MPRYNQTKYNQGGKYGRYELELGNQIPLQSLKQYRLRTISKDQTESRPIVNRSIVIKNIIAPAKVRIRSKGGHWVYQDSIKIEGNPLKVRVKAVNKNSESCYVECVTGTIR